MLTLWLVGDGPESGQGELGPALPAHGLSQRRPGYTLAEAGGYRAREGGVFLPLSHRNSRGFRPLLHLEPQSHPRLAFYQKRKKGFLKGSARTIALPHPKQSRKPVPTGALQSDRRTRSAYRHQPQPPPHPYWPADKLRHPRTVEIPIRQMR